jgi:hypothetical protein
MKNTLSLALLATLPLAVAAHADSAYPKGNCEIAGKQIPMVLVHEGEELYENYWQADLGPGARATVTFRPGYGTTFVRLAITEPGPNGNHAGTGLTYPGFATADSTTDDTPGNTMNRFTTLSLEFLQLPALRSQIKLTTFHHFWYVVRHEIVRTPIRGVGFSLGSSRFGSSGS